jgi:hypothetical protein
VGRRQKAEGRRQKAEDRRQKVRNQKAAGFWSGGVVYEKTGCERALHHVSNYVG